MEFEERRIERARVRDEIFAVLKAHNFASYIDRLNFAARTIEDLTGRGRELHAFLEETYARLDQSGKIQKIRHTVNDSTLQRSEETYSRLYIQGIIFDEVMALVREGIIMLANIIPNQMQWTGRYVFDPNHILVTEYGARVLEDYQSIPYFADDYIKILEKTAVPDDELRGYLSEGLACLQGNLPRAATLLLRLPCEHLLQKLIDAVDAKLPDQQGKNDFKGKIRKASTNIERRANAVFDQLEFDVALLANATYLRDRLRNELKPTFHTIREFAGNAAHRNVPIDRQQVRDFYGVFASTVYPITINIIEYLQQP